MSLATEDLHRVFLRPFGSEVAGNSDPQEKPLLVDLKHPHPPRLSVYLYNLVEGSGLSRRREYKVSLRVPGQKTGEYGSFQQEPGRFTVLAGYRADLDVFVLWDAALRPRFKAGGNIQAASSAVLRAAALGQARQLRELTSVSATELVICCQSPTLPESIRLRVLNTGGVERDHAE